MEVMMAATLRNLLSALRGKQMLEKAKNRPRKHSPEGLRIARDILDNFKFPGDDDTPQQDDTKE
jgi:hypothetical protein